MRYVDGFVLPVACHTQSSNQPRDGPRKPEAGLTTEIHEEE